MSVWSAEKFARGDINTWPFENDYILAFRGTSREIFFPKEHSSSLKNLPGSEDKKLGSVLNTRYLIPENNNGNTGETPFRVWKSWYINHIKQLEGLTDEEAESIWREFLESGKENRSSKYKEKLDVRQPGNFFAPRHVVEEKGYYRPNSPESILLKAHIPTELVTVINRLKNQDNIRCDSLEFMKRSYTKEEFREQCRIATQGRNNEQLQYATADLNLKYIKGVEDQEMKKEFMSLSEYVKRLKKKCVWEMDQFSFSVKAHDDIKEEMEFLQQLEYNLQKIKYYLQKIDSRAHKVEEITEKIQDKYGADWKKYRSPRESELSQTLEFLTSIEKCLSGEDIKGPGYPRVRKQLYSMLEKQTSYFSDRNNSPWNQGYKQDLETRFEEENISNVKQLFKDLDRHLEIVYKIEEEIEQVRKEEKQHINKKDWDEKQYEKERRLERKIDERLAQEITQLPNIKALEQEITEKRRRAQEEKQELSKGNNPSPTNYLGL